MTHEDTNQTQSTNNQAVLTFGAHPKRTLHVQLFHQVSNPSDVATKSIAYCASSDENLPSDDRPHGTFAILWADPIVSLRQISVAANTALTRERRRQRKQRLREKQLQEDQQQQEGKKDASEGDAVAVASNPSPLKKRPRVGTEDNKGNATNTNDKENKDRRERGIALDTVFCVGGSLNEPTVMRQFGFRGEGASNETTSVFVLAYDTTDKYLNKYAQQVLGNDATPAPLSDIGEKFSKGHMSANPSWKQQVMKLYKLSPSELEPLQDQGGVEDGTSRWEDAVVTRVATKFSL